jgi:phosphohistidine swiveling domain-containing protein
MKPIYLIYTRDVSLFVGQFFWRRLLNQEVRRVWGQSLSTQICHYNGHGLEMYRVIQDTEDLKNYVAHLPLTHYLFSEDFKNLVRAKAEELRDVLTRVETTKLVDLKILFEKYLDLWAQVYPGYMFSIFLPGAFAEAFRAEKGEAAEVYIQTQLDNRRLLEGLFVETDHFARQVVEKFLTFHQIPSRFSIFLSFDETYDLVMNDKKPNLETLQQRSGGYVLIGDELIIDDFKKVLLERDFSFVFPETEGVASFKGNIACQGKPVTGRVRLVFTQDDVRNFTDGEILVTSMTAPHHLPAIKKSTAVVTDEGGITCHAAITARELQRPCIIGTKIATKVLKDGDLIELDAEKGVINILKKV